MPTSPPPQVPDVFGQFIDPKVAQQNTLDQYQQGQQVQNQGRQFSGREGALGQGAGLLSKFIQGASIGRANADAKTAHSEAMKSAQDAQHLNAYIEMVQNNSSLDPDAKQQLVAKAYSHQGQMAETILKESDSPIAKILHPIFQGLMGGAPANESTKTDSKTGKKSKVRTEYKGPDEDAFKGLMSDYFNASQNQTIEKTYPVKSAALIDQAKQVAAGVAHVNGQEPDREQVQRAIAPLLSQGDALAQKYGMKTNPVSDWLETYKPKLQGTQLLQQTQAEELQGVMDEEKQIRSGQQTQTQPPPSRDQFSLAPGQGPGSRVGQPETPAQRDANTPVTAGGTEKSPGWVSPSFLQRAAGVGRAEQKEYVVDDDKTIPTYTWGGKIFDLSGNPIDPKRIGKPVLDAKGTLTSVEKTGPDGKPYAVRAVIGKDNKVTIPTLNGEPLKVPQTAAGARTQMTEVFQSVQRLETEASQLRNRMLNVDKEVAADFTITPKNRPAEIARRRSIIQGSMNQVEKNLDANQRLLQQYGGPGGLYDTGGASAPPPSEPATIMDNLPDQ